MNSRVFSFIFAFALINTCLAATELPKTVSKNHFEAFENSTITNWVSSSTGEEKLFLVEFTHNEWRNEAYYDQTGRLQSHLIYIKFIPESITSFVQEQYENAEIKNLVLRKEFEKGTTSSTIYTVLIKSEKGIFPISLSFESATDKLELLAHH